MRGMNLQKIMIFTTKVLREKVRREVGEVFLTELIVGNVASSLQLFTVSNTSWCSKENCTKLFSFPVEAVLLKLACPCPVLLKQQVN